MMSMKTIPSVFEKLVKQAEELIKSDLSAEQAVAVLTSKGNIVCFANHQVTSGSTEDEEVFGKILVGREDTRVMHAVCMWNDFTIDAVSHHLRNLLIELNPSNVETEILLSTGEGYRVTSWNGWMP